MNENNMQNNSSQNNSAMLKKSLFDELEILKPRFIHTRIKQIMVNNGPVALRTLLALCPLAINQNMVEKVANHIFKPQLASGELSFLYNNTLRISINDLNRHYCFNVTPEKIKVLRRCKQVDVSLETDYNHFVLLATQAVDPDTLFFSRKLSIEGNTELGMLFKSFIENLSLDLIPQPYQAILNKQSDWIQQVNLGQKI
jgi:O2-independent ubiquinone biosynthesis accessory factor UbiT